MRVACLLIPDLPLQAELRAHPELAREPVVVVSGPDARAEVVAVSPRAAAAGVRPQSSLVQARAACGGLRVRVASPDLERAARETLRDVALSFSPRVEPVPRAGGAWAAEAAVLLDAVGVRSLFRSEAGYAGALATRSRALGLPGCVAVASSRGVAHLAARCLARRCGSEGDETDTHVLDPGDEAAFLAPLPLDLLDPDDDLAQRLTRFGIRTIRDLERLPRRALAERLGPGALPLADRARGRADETPIARPPSAPLEEAGDLEYAVDRIEPLLFALRGPLSRLLLRLEARQLGCGPLDLELGLASGERDARRIGVASPTRDARVLLRLISLSLESRPPGAPVERVALRTEGRATRSDQLDLFRPRGPAPAELSRTLAELEAVCGPGHVGTPRVADDHRPDAWSLTRFEPSRGTSPREPPHPGLDPTPNRPSPAPVLAVRALRPPVSAQVRLNRGQPSWLQSSVARGVVVRAAGPWRTSGRWWSQAERFAFDTFDVWLECGTLLRLRHDLLRKVWQIDAIYD